MTSSADVRVKVGEKPNIFISDASVDEGAKGTESNATFTVTLSGAQEIPVEFDYATVDRTAFAGVEGGTDADYIAAKSTMVFEPGETSKTITVRVIGDNVREPKETFAVELSNVKNARVTFGRGIGSILNDDPLPTVSASIVSVTEGNAGTQDALMTVTVTGEFRDTITVDYITADGTATNGSDYSGVAGRLTFEAGGPTSQTIEIDIFGDTTKEKNENFTFRLSNTVNATVGGQGKVTIVDDDAPPVAAITPALGSPVAMGDAVDRTRVFLIDTSARQLMSGWTIS